MKKFYCVSIGLALTIAFAGPASAGLLPADPFFDNTFFQDSMRMKKQGKGSYIDLNTGKPVTIRYDLTTRTSYNTTTNDPIKFYINTNTGDTVYGGGKYIVNNYLMRSPQGGWSLDTTRVRVTSSGLWSIQDNTELKKDKMHKHKKNKPGSMQPQQQPQQ